ncbi:MAG: molybdopterin molybdenumtransferase MoeA, partial [Bacteroidota bacterium]
MKNRLISFDEARELLLKQAKPLGVEPVFLDSAHGRVLAAAVKAPSDQPGFDQAAMDGYVFRIADLSGSKGLHVCGVRKAGAIEKLKVRANQAVRIFTGAAIPKGLDSLVAQELVELQESRVYCQDQQIFKGKNIRLKGSHIKKGEILFDRGQYLNAGAISSLATAGINMVSVYK